MAAITRSFLSVSLSFSLSVSLSLCLSVCLSLSLSRSLSPALFASLVSAFLSACPLSGSVRISVILFPLSPMNNSPVSIAAVVAAHGFDDRIIDSVLREMIGDGSLCGTLRGREYVPSVFTVFQRNSAETFLRQNEHLPFDRAAKLQVRCLARITCSRTPPDALLLFTLCQCSPHDWLVRSRTRTRF
jgi:hypothetical protein